jgi:hypothetical protein
MLMGDLGVGDMPDASQCALVKVLANAVDVLSTDDRFPVSLWQLGDYLHRNYEDAKGEGSATFLKVTVKKALEQMKQTEMLEVNPNGVRLTENGRWSLLGEATTPSKKVVDDSGSTAKEPEAGRELPEGSLLKKDEAKLSALGVNLTAPELLMAREEPNWSMKVFLKKAGDFAPTLVLIRMKNGTECGGVAGGPWPKKPELAADPAKGSFIFSLGATPARFDLVKPEKALICTFWSFVFGYGFDLYVSRVGSGCGSESQGDYAGPRERGQLIGGTTESRVQPYGRWELWRL